ncbi:pyrazinamidase/nicotinamidase, putative [Eimeria necatrix]|uniref:nicotinamidase n=1 Tax=Eimeria necatrix TaxID=51315 RepID=U6N6B6_9EIME|nr:pyrazinamidase/nicotinamidase, putative [Eimeria necatrix]CDJ70235.1 pyrazinamidase/nicotinamidase, putative [Eimeria necatrix]
MVNCQAGKGVCCLLVTDAQNDFCEGALAAPAGLAVVRRIGEALRHARKQGQKTVGRYSSGEGSACESGCITEVDCCKEITSKQMLQAITSASTDANGTRQEDISRNLWDIVIFSLDWHPSNHVSFLSSHSKECIRSICACGNASLPHAAAQQAAGAAVKKAMTSLDPDANWTVVSSASSSEASAATICRLWPTHCVQGTHGSKLHGAVHADLGDFVVFKGSDTSAECFSACGAESAPTGLVPLLRSKAVETVAVCGFCLEFCVAETAVSLRAAGFPNVVVLTDLTAAIFEEKQRETLEYLNSQGVRCLTLETFATERTLFSIDLPSSE